MYVYIYIYARMHVHKQISKHTYIDMYAYVYIYIDIPHTCMCIFVVKTSDEGVRLKDPGQCRAQQAHSLAVGTDGRGMPSI